MTKYLFSSENGYFVDSLNALHVSMKGIDFLLIISM